MSKETVKIHIDNKPLDSPDPTTGAALYVLGNINAAEYDLWRKVPGKGDDILIPNDNTVVDLKKGGDHFYSAQKRLNPGNE
jgi:hypothetical protein